MEKISYKIDDDTFSTELIAEKSVEKSNLETIIFRVVLIILILYIVYIILKILNKPKDKNRKSPLYTAKRSKKTKRTKSKKGGRYKFNQINGF